MPLPSFFRTSTGHRVGEGNAWHSEYPATNSTLGGISAISPFALATALLFASLLGWSGVSRPLLSTFTSGLSAVRVAPVDCRIWLRRHTGICADGTFTRKFSR